jgi:cyanate permease
MALSATALTLGTFGLIGVSEIHGAYLAAGVFGIGIGGIMTLLPLAWIDYFGRESYGAIRGVALSLQVLAQAVGPLLSGVLRDRSGTYTYSLVVLGSFAAIAIGAALAAQRPRVAP